MGRSGWDKQVSGQQPGAMVLPIQDCQEQIDRGFGRLRFVRAIEAAYRVYHSQISLVRLRPALAIIALFGALIAAINLTLSGEQTKTTWIVLPAVIGELAVVAMLAGCYLKTGLRHLQALGIMLALTLGFISLLVGANVDPGAAPGLFSAHLVITVCVYLLLGLRFLVALPIAACLAVCFAASACLTGVDAVTLSNHLVYILVSNVAGATALYNLEHSRRRDFLEQQVLEHLARRDAMTGLFNRQYMDETFARCWANAAEAKRPVAVAIVDIDHFKTFNDEYGHQKGDDCLRAVAAVLQTIAQQDANTVFRYGGEEFLILLDNVSLEAVEEFGDLVCRRVESLQIMHGKSTTAPVVTVSVGVSFTMPHESKRNIREFLQLADESLYAAKEAGRNRSVLAIGSTGHSATGVYMSDERVDDSAVSDGEIAPT